MVVKDAEIDDGGDNCKSVGLEDDEFSIDGDELKETKFFIETFFIRFGFVIEFTFLESVAQNSMN